MNLNFRALCYLHAFDNRLPIQNGLAFEGLLRESRLDYSVQSLERIDSFLDTLREAGHLNEDTYLDDPANQNLLYLLAFYVGEVIARSLACQPCWLTYEDAAAAGTGITLNGPIFENSAQLSFPDSPQVATKYFLPLVSLISRLFDEHVTKSVLFSAGFLLPPQAQQQPVSSLPLPVVPPRWPIDVAAQVRASTAGQLAALQVTRPPWARGDDLSYLFDHAQALLHEGRVVWGALVQANTSLFEPGHFGGGAWRGAV